MTTFDLSGQHQPSINAVLFTLIMTEVTVHDVVVIGAGLSGLSAAKVLLEREVDVLVLEANDRVGGRTWTVKNPQIGWADLGGSYIRPTQNHALRMIKEFGLQMYSADETGSKVFFDGFSGTRTIFKQSPNLGFLANLDLNHIFRLLDQLGGQLPENEPWNAPQAELWDQMTFKLFVEKNTVTRRAREYMRNFVATMVTAEAYQCSLLWFLWFIKQCGGTKTLFASGGLEWKLVGGAAQLSELLAQTLGTEKVLLNEPVCSIDQAEDQSIVVRTVNGSVFHAKYLIMATPPAVQQKIHYRPALPPMRNQLLQRLPQGSVYKCMVYYENAFWRDLNLNGCLVFVGDDQQYPMPYTFEDSKPDGSKPAILGFIPGDRARKLTLLTREERLRIICSSFAKAFQTDLATKPVHYEEYNWMADQYCGGGYMMNANVGFLTRFGPHLAEPVGRMFFAGTECAIHWSGYMDGAIQAGEKAARQVMLQLDLIKADQVDQSEPISREYPPPGPFDSTLFQLYAPSGKTFVKSLTITSMTVVSIVAVTFGLLRYCPRSIRT